MPISCSHPAPADLQHHSLRVLSASCGLNLRLPIFLGRMEWQSQDISMPRKDACTQTSPARRKIGHAQVQGAGKSICRWVGASGVGLPLLRAVLMVWGLEEEQTRASQSARIPTIHRPLCDSFALDH